jgi:hypothetical protein
MGSGEHLPLRHSARSLRVRQGGCTCAPACGRSPFPPPQELLVAERPAGADVPAKAVGLPARRRVVDINAPVPITGGHPSSPLPDRPARQAPPQPPSPPPRPTAPRRRAPPARAAGPRHPVAAPPPPSATLPEKPQRPVNAPPKKSRGGPGEIISPGFLSVRSRKFRRAETTPSRRPSAQGRFEARLKTSFWFASLSGGPCQA